MFAYGQLSDLKDGTLVTPIKKNGNFIECSMEDGTIKSFSFDDFDFSKSPSDRLNVEVIIDETEVGGSDNNDNNIDSDGSDDAGDIYPPNEPTVDETIYIDIPELKLIQKLSKISLRLDKDIDNNYYWIETSEKLIFSEALTI